MLEDPLLNDPELPLVTVTIHNFNYGRFLTQCIDSIVAQTYQNIEICFSDNSSDDDSWRIALDYAAKYPKVMTVTRNRRNFGGEANLSSCLLGAHGKYLVTLCSDDVLAPTYCEQCVRVLEAYPRAGFVMVNRCIIDEDNRITEEPPFYNQSCIIPGKEQAAVYMMASVNPCISQIMYNWELSGDKRVTGSMASNWYGTRIMDFSICCEHPIAYIKQSLVLNREHSKSDSSALATNLMQIIGPYVLQHQFADTASLRGMKNVSDRLPSSLDKLSHLCLRYCVRFLNNNNMEAGKRYFHLSVAMMPQITEDPIFQTIQEYWSADSHRKAEIISSLQAVSSLTHRVISYDPPTGSIPIEIDQ